MSQLSQIVSKLRRLVGNDNVTTDSKLLTEAQTATYPTTTKVIALVTPGNTDQLQAVVEIAKRARIPIYVYSTGKNWGYGSRIPQTTGSLLIGLSRMNRILDFDGSLGYVTLEPGVTQSQLHEFLKRQHANFSLSTTGSSPDSSLIGNICERGVGIGPYGFRSHFVSDLEVLLPSGKFIHTGFGRYANAKAAKVYPEGIGPSVYDLFLQSNLGIITKLTMFLAPTPKFSQVIHLAIASDQVLPRYLKILHQFNFLSSVKKSITIRKDLQLLLLNTQYPWNLTNDTPLPAQITHQLKRQYNIKLAWEATVDIFGYTRAEVATQIEYFKTLAPDLEGVTFSTLYSENALPDQPLNISDSLYWRMKIKPPEVKNPDADGCGIIRLSVVSPFRATDICTVVSLMSATITRFKLEPFLEAHSISDRSVVIIAPILYDRTVPGEDDNALQCHDTLLSLLVRKGYYPYRDNGRAMARLPSSSDGFDEFSRDLKTALDPGHIFSPGRYQK